MFDVTSYGAVGDGVTDDQPSIQSAIDAAQLAGGGVVYIPRGTYLLGGKVGIQSLLVDTNNIYIKGDGVGLSVLKLDDNVDAHMINFMYTNGGGVEGLEFDGNMTNQTGSYHCVRGEGISNWTLDNFFVHHASGYGIGFQDGTIRCVTIANGRIEDTGSDGFDCKNRNDDNSDNTMDNVHVRRHGLNEALVGQAGLDFRGIWTVSNVTVREYAYPATVGIRFREGETSDESGLGGHYSSIVNFFVRASSTTSTVGLEINSYMMQATNGHVTNCGVGVTLRQHEVVLGQVIARSCGDGFVVQNSTLPTNGDRSILTGCIARSCAGNGFKVQADYVNLNGIIARNNDVGVRIESSASHTIASGISQNSTTSNFINSGTNTHDFLY